MKKDMKIAITGVAMRLPGGISDGNDLNKLIFSGKHAVTNVPEARQSFLSGERYACYLDDVDVFDNSYFNLSKRESSLMDPQHRLMLQAVVQAVESSGYSMQEIAGTKTGVFLGISSYDYNNLSILNDVQGVHSIFGNAPHFMANRISYLLDLHGPSMVIDTACSSSLVALHQAIQAIENDDCEQAIVGGVNLILAERYFDTFEEAGMLSPTNLCKTFAEDADGYVRGEGVIAILIKKLSSAEKLRDNIRGLIVGSGINHGGRANTLTSPNPLQQAELISSVYTKFGIGFDTLGYIETHGTGTSLGDLIEVEGIKHAFSEMPISTSTEQKCALGSVKPNLGHLEAAAGLVGLVKVLGCFDEQKIPPSINIAKLNSNICLEDSPFYITDSAREWQSSYDRSCDTYVRRAGLSSFGIGGVNVHVILEEYLKKELQSRQNWPLYIFTVSAKTTSALERQIAELARYFEVLNDRHHPADICYTLNIGREHHTERSVYIAPSLDILSKQLRKSLQVEDKTQRVFYDSSNSVFASLQLENSDSSYVNQVIDAHKIACFERSDDCLTTALTLANLYVEGRQIDWSRIFADYEYYRVNIPAYQFDTKQHWI